MNHHYTAPREPGKALVEFPQKPASLHRQLAAVMGRRKVVAVFPPGRDSADSEEIFFVVRGSVIAELGGLLDDAAAADFHDRHFGDVEVVS